MPANYSHIKGARSSICMLSFCLGMSHCFDLTMMLQGDVREMQDCEKAVAAATDRWGRLDILVNAAAGNFLAPAEILSPKGFKTGIRSGTSIYCSVHTLLCTYYCCCYRPSNLLHCQQGTACSLVLLEGRDLVCLYLNSRLGQTQHSSTHSPMKVYCAKLHQD